MLDGGPHSEKNSVKRGKAVVTVLVVAEAWVAMVVKVAVVVVIVAMVPVLLLLTFGCVVYCFSQRSEKNSVIGIL